MAPNADYNIRMGNTPTLRLLLASTILAMAGCGQPSSGPIDDGPSTLTPQTVTIYELAGQLGLHVSESKPTHVRLKNSANTVMLFTVTDGRVYVNAKPVGTMGTIEKTNRGIRVSIQKWMCWQIIFQKVLNMKLDLILPCLSPQV